MTSLEIVLFALVAIVIVVAAGLIVAQHGRLRSRVATAESALADLAAALDTAPADLKGILGDGKRQLITIEILNPMELASAQSKFAKHFGGLTPAMIRREVTKRTVGELAARLREQGVEAEVRIHDAH